VIMRVGTRFLCQNPSCGCEVEVIDVSSEAESDPRCSCCGSAMKKPYQKPVLKNLDAESKEIAHLFESDASCRLGEAKISVGRCPSKYSASSDTPNASENLRKPE
jgi:hypothetical protein